MKFNLISKVGQYLDVKMELSNLLNLRFALESEKKKSWYFGIEVFYTLHKKLAPLKLTDTRTTCIG